MKLKINIKRMNNAKGYTLVELLIAIALIALLGASSFTLYSTTRMRARDAVREGDILAIRSAVEQHFALYQKYPAPLDFSASIFGEFLPSVPKDPMGLKPDKHTKFGYVYAASHAADGGVPGQEYELSANYEKLDDGESNEREIEDNGDDLRRWELGTKTDFVRTNLPHDDTVCTDDNEYAIGDGGLGACVIIDELSN